MSSGKSTVINALLDEDILPSLNKACTAKVYSILSDNSINSSKLYITMNDGDVKVIEENLSDELNKINNDNSVRDILILSKMKGIINTNKSLLVIDTPGPNNSCDIMHNKITLDTLNKIEKGLILYVINITQMGIKDDLELLNKVKDYLITHKDINILFVINKMDQVDFERESVIELIQDTKKYIEQSGIKNPYIIPVSALAASLFRKVLKSERLTRNQYKNFIKCYDLFKTSDLRMESYVINSSMINQFSEISVMNEKYTVAEIMAAIDNTGITYLEKCIQRNQIFSSKNKSVKINIRDKEGNIIW